MKAITSGISALAVAVSLNAAYWGWSEVYIRGGDIYQGLILGVISSAACVSIPFIILLLTRRG